jgi:succinate-acetate transporter protein
MKIPATVVPEDGATPALFQFLKSGSFVFFSLFEPPSPLGLGGRARVAWLVCFSDSGCCDRFISDLSVAPVVGAFGGMRQALCGRR